MCIPAQKSYMEIARIQETWSSSFLCQDKTPQGLSLLVLVKSKQSHPRNCMVIVEGLCKRAHILRGARHSNPPPAPTE